jgi:hypothetical protein
MEGGREIYVGMCWFLGMFKTKAKDLSIAGYTPHGQQALPRQKLIRF